MRVQLDALREKQPPLPVAPIVRTSKNVSADGTITINKVISGSALGKIGTSNSGNRQAVVNIGTTNAGTRNVSASRNSNPAIKASSSKGWPPQALADWAAWGSKDTARFFALWSELAEGNSSLGGPAP